MPPTPRLVILAALALSAAGLPDVARPDSIRCQGGLVAVGDSKLDLIGKCGPPALQEEQAEERSRLRFDAASRIATGRTAAVTVERWTYNFGPRQFVQVVTLEGGRVQAVERGGYGYDLGAQRSDGPAIPRSRCDQLAFHEGDSSFDVLARCGEPATRDLKVVTLSAGGASRDGTTFQATTRTVTVEIWTYDLGPQALVRRLSFEDGKVIRVETGGYGYSRLDGR